MKVNFLSADVKLTKTFEEIAPGKFKSTSYPLVSRFTSIERDIGTPEEFTLYLQAAAQEGMCLLKGNLDRPLVDESRARHTNATHLTDYVVLDIDYPVVDMTPAEFVDALDPQLKDVSFIFQASSSQGIAQVEGWRGHIFLWLGKSLSPLALKQWLIHLNLVVPHLTDRISLSASGGALIYPLDVTTCQNDKLIYIAPPVCKGFEDPIHDQRIQYIEREFKGVTLDLSEVSAQKNKERTEELLRRLRQSQGLPEKKFSTTNHHGWDVLENPDPVMVTGKKEERGFVYLNLNGGDSWGYYFPASSPEILYNFKNEPCMYMRDVDEDIYREYAVPCIDTEGAVPFGFLWPDDDNYYRGFANPETRELLWIKSTGSKQKLRDFFSGNGVKLEPGYAVPEWEIVFDPAHDAYADFRQRRVNTHRRSEYIRNATKGCRTLPPAIGRVIRSICVNEETERHFLNWLASLVQCPRQSGTGWIFQGVQGTGKGVLFNQVIVPLFGQDQCHEITMDRLGDDFNLFLRHKLFLFIDEAKISDTHGNGARMLNRIKNYITEPRIHIRGMRRDAMLCDNYTNIILASNHDDIIPLDVTDRRFNVAPRQEKPLPLFAEDIDEIRAELQDLTNYLYTFEVDEKLASRVMENAARAQLIQLSETTVDAFFHAVREGDLEYFTQYLKQPGSMSANILYNDYALVVKQWIQTLGNEAAISRDDLQVAYHYLQGNSVSASKFSRMAKKYGLEIRPVRVDGEVTRGIPVTWHLSEEERALLIEGKDTKNVVTMRRGYDG